MTVPLTDSLHDVYRNRRSTSKHPFILPGRHVVILTEYFIKITAVAIAQHERNLFNRKRRTLQKNACPLHARFQEEPEQLASADKTGRKERKNVSLRMRIPIMIKSSSSRLLSAYPHFPLTDRDIDRKSVV